VSRFYWNKITERKGKGKGKRERGKIVGDMERLTTCGALSDPQHAVLCSLPERELLGDDKVV